MLSSFPQPRKNIIWLTLLIFVSCFVIGLGLSVRKPLWNDESFSQSQNIEMFSYSELFLGKTLYEGNKCPLFYVMQKAFCQVIGYKFPFVWEQQWLLHDTRSQIILRLNPILFMSLMIALIFFYFANEYSLLSGLCSVVTSLSFPMIWLYWADARPYAMWLFFSTAQLILFLIILKEKDQSQRAVFYKGLMLVNLLMAFTISIAIAQIAIISGFLWALKERHYKRHFFITFLPMVICFLYYFFTPKTLTKYFPLHNPLDLMYACVGESWVIFFGAYFFIIIGLLLAKKSQLLSTGATFVYDPKKGSSCLIVFGLIVVMYCAAFLILANLMSRIVPSDQAAHYIHERYFMFLVPLAIISINLFFNHLAEIVKKNKWLLMNLILVFVGLLGVGYFDTFIRIVSKHLYF